MTDEQLALSIGRAVLDAIKAYQPEVRIEREHAEYRSIRQLADDFGKSQRTIQTLVKEIREQIGRGRYPDDAVLDGCGIVVRLDVFVDYLKHRKALKDPVAAKFVEEWKDKVQ